MKKNKRLILQNYTPQEWDVGVLIKSDEIFNLRRRKLRPETYLQQDLRQLVEIMIEHGNSTEAICRVDRRLAEYAMTLCNYVLNWTIQSPCKEE